MTKEERIQKLQKGIASEETPAHIRANMEELLEALQRPEPPPPPPPVPVKARPKPKPKPAPAPAPPPPPPPPPARVFTPEEKEARVAEIRAIHARRKLKEE